jgi:cell division protein ZapA (FtsZ GTPase activity inhibitor)
MRIDLLGTSFSVETDEDPEYFREVVEHFKSKVLEIQQSVSTGDPLKIAILAGILAADDYMKLTGETRCDGSEARTITESLISQLDAALECDGASVAGDESPATDEGID